MSEETDIQEESFENENSKSKDVNENISQEQTIESTPPQTQDSQLPTENMEVHKHPHHVMHKKKWIEYLLEFFMLFLAVFLGFVAENIRENELNKEREKEYIISLVEDLKNDSAFLALSINKLIPYHLTWLDSTVHLLQSPDLGGKDRQIYQAFMIGTAWAYNFHYTERTLSQLHSEGFHLIRNKNATNIINELESQYKIFNTQIRTFSENMQNDIDLSAWVFADRVVANEINTTAFQHFSDSASVDLQLPDIPESAKINSENKEDIKSYVDKLRQYSFYLLYVIKGGQVVLLREISKAINILKKEYHLE